MKFKRSIFVFAVGLFFFCFKGAKPVFAANWQCPDAQTYFNCFNRGLTNCGDLGCVDLDVTPYCSDDPTNCNCIASGSECSGQASNVCNLTDWTYKFNGVCVRPSPNDSGQCSGAWQFKYNQCNAGDRCEDASVGNVQNTCGGTVYSGTNSTGVIMAGICDAAGCPTTGCKNGGWYKTCCKYTDVDHSGGPSAGDTLTGAKSACASCVNTDCCSNTAGGTCVVGTSCTAGATLGSYNYCWSLGGVPTSTPGPSPTPAPPAPTSAPAICTKGGSPADPKVCDSWIEVNLPTTATVGQSVSLAIYIHPGWNTSCFGNSTVNASTETGPGVVTLPVSSWSVVRADGSIGIETGGVTQYFSTGVKRGTSLWNTTGAAAGTYCFSAYYGGHNDNCNWASCCDYEINASAGNNPPWSRITLLGLLGVTRNRCITLVAATPTPTLSGPTGLSAVCLANNQAQVSWSAVTGATGYKVQTCDHSVPQPCSVATYNVTAPNTSTTVTALCGHGYGWWVQTLPNGGTTTAGPYINCACPTSTPTPLPAKTCTVNGPSAPLLVGNSVSLSAFGRGNTSTAFNPAGEPVRLYLESSSGDAISGLSGGWISGAGNTYYQLGSCNSVNFAQCNIPAWTSSALPAGSYYIHCDLPNELPPTRCSGNPLETGWARCSTSDRLSFSILPPGITPTITPIPTPTSAVCTTATAPSVWVINNKSYQNQLDFRWTTTGGFEREYERYNLASKTSACNSGTREINLCPVTDDQRTETVNTNDTDKYICVRLRCKNYPGDPTCTSCPSNNGTTCCVSSWTESPKCTLCKQPTSISLNSTGCSKVDSGGTTITWEGTRMTWTDASGVETGYVVYRCPKGTSCPADQAQAVAWLSAGSSSYTDCSDPRFDFDSYTYAVRCYTEEANCGTISKTTPTPLPTITPVPAACPVCPASPLLTSSIRSDENYNINITWVDPNRGTQQETGYKIYRCSGSTCPFSSATFLTITPANRVSFTDNNNNLGFLCGTVWSYWVVPTKLPCTEPNCTRKVITLPACSGCVDTCPSNPTMVSPATSYHPPTNSVTLQWSESDWGVTVCPNESVRNNHFILYVSTTNDGPVSGRLNGASGLLSGFPMTLDNSVTSHSVNNLAEGVWYYWQVRAENKNTEICNAYSNIRTFQYNPTIDPWWQTADGDVHAQTDIIDPIASCADDKYLSLKGDGGMPGVVSFGNSLTIPDQTSVSERSWQAKTSHTATQIGYDYLINKLNVNATAMPGSGKTRNMPDEGIYLWDDTDITLNGAVIPADKKVIIFTTGDIKIGSSDLTVEKGGFFALISKGDISFGVNIQNAHGFYLADGTLTVNKKPAGNDNRFFGEGSFIGWGGVSLPRNLGSTNNCLPAEVFTLRPDLFINAPSEFQSNLSFFQEVAP